MNIGIFTDTYIPQINGVATSINMLQKELTRMGHKVYIFTTTDPDAREKIPNLFRFPSMPFVFLPAYRLSYIYPPKLMLSMKKFKLDIIHTQTEFSIGIFGKVVADFHKIPTVHTYHTMYEDYVHYIKGRIVTPKMAQGYSKFFCNGAKAVVVPVEKTQKKLIEYGVKKPVQIIPTGIDFEPFAGGTYSDEEIMAAREEIGLTKDDKVLITIGRIGKEKSLDVTVSQLPNMLKICPELKYVLIGIGPMADVLKQQAESLGVGHALIIAGSRPWNRIGLYYQMADAFISASTSETQGLVYIESIAAGTIVIAKNDPVIDGIIINNKTGLLFNAPEEIAECISTAMHDTEHRKNMIEAAYQNIKHLSSQQFAKNIEKLYYDVLNEIDNQKLNELKKRHDKFKRFTNFIKSARKK